MKHKWLFLSFLCIGSLFANNRCDAYEFYTSFLYLQPNSSNLYYGAEAKPLPIPTPNWESLEISPSFNPGFEVGAKMCLIQKNTQVNIGWESLHSSDSASKTVLDEDMLGPYFNIGPDSQPYKIARGDVDHEFDSVKFTLEKQFNYRNSFNVNYYAGLAYTRIKQTMHSYFSNEDATITRDIKSPSLYNGFGPKFGADISYNVCDGFAFTGGFSVSILTGKLENSTGYLSTTPLLEVLSITPPNKQTTHVADRTQVVPGITEKLGIAYSTCYNQCPIKLEIGYQVQAYINAIQSVDMSVEVTTPPQDTQVGVYALGFQRTLSNFLLTGPYLTLEMTF